MFSFSKNKKSLFALKLIVSLLLVAWLVLSVDWNQVWGYIKEIHIGWLALYIALVILGIMISARKWQVLSANKGFCKRYGWHFQTYLTGSFINNFLPSVVGGDTYRAVALGKDASGHRSPAVSTVLFDRLSGLWTLALMAFLFSLVNITEVMQYALWAVCVAGIGVFLVLHFVIAPKRSRLYLMQYIPIRTEKFQRLTRELARYTTSPVLKEALGYSALFVFLGVGIANYALFLALGAQVNIVTFLSVIFLINILSAAPISINNIGVKEWAYYVFFGFIGLAPELAVTAAILGRFVQMILSFFALPGYVREKR